MPLKTNQQLKEGESWRKRKEKERQEEVTSKLFAEIKKLMRTVMEKEVLLSQLSCHDSINNSVYYYIYMFVYMYVYSYL